MLIGFLALALATLVVVDEGVAPSGTSPPSEKLDAASDEGRWGLVVLPRITLSVDDGLGLGMRGAAFWYRGDSSPYKTAISFQLWGTTNLVQHHHVRVDAIDAFNSPLRIEAEAGLFQTRSMNFCGLAEDAQCVDVGTRTKLRFISPYGSLLGRLRIVETPKTQLAFGWRGTGYVPGTWGDFTPYAGSVYGGLKREGETGLVSQLLAGVVTDTRDFEPAPTKGMTGLLLVRAADPLLGSTWRFAGAHAQLLVFSPLAGPRVVLAQRVIGDVLIGDPPLLELLKVGGLQESYAWGGQDLGRGLRLTRSVGAVKLLAQEELRIDLFHLDVLGNDVGVGTGFFFDVGAVADDLPSVTAAVPRLSFGAGLALRIAWNRNFVMRVDVGMSPDEGARVGLYTAPGHPF